MLCTTQNRFITETALRTFQSGLAKPSSCTDRCF